MYNNTIYTIANLWGSTDILSVGIEFFVSFILGIQCRVQEGILHILSLTMIKDTDEDLRYTFTFNNFTQKCVKRAQGVGGVNFACVGCQQDGLRGQMAPQYIC
jgi:hypothetical protein